MPQLRIFDYLIFLRKSGVGDCEITIFTNNMYFYMLSE